MKSLGHYSIEVVKDGMSVKVAAAGIIGLVIVLLLALVAVIHLFT
jgi:hypothetical protein